MQTSQMDDVVTKDGKLNVGSFRTVGGAVVSVERWDNEYPVAVRLEQGTMESIPLDATELRQLSKLFKRLARYAESRPHPYDI